MAGPRSLAAATATPVAMLRTTEIASPWKPCRIPYLPAWELSGRQAPASRFWQSGWDLELGFGLEELAGVVISCEVCRFADFQICVRRRPFCEEHWI